MRRTSRSLVIPAPPVTPPRSNHPATSTPPGARPGRVRLCVLAAELTGGQTYYLFLDHLGSTHITASGINGAELGKLLYKPWGETRLSTGTTLTTWRFTGQREDATIGLYYYGARYYDSQLGRFAQPDTIVPNPGDPQSLNRYSYVGNRPMVAVDPSGHCTVDASGNIAVDANGQIAETNCTVDMFHALTWAQRMQWLQLFVGQNNLDSWFSDIMGAIGYLANDPQFGQMNSRIAYMDAGVLQAINDGRRLYGGESAVGFNGGNGGAGWEQFFAALYSAGNSEDASNSLIAIRLNAEQQGVDYAKGLPEAQRRYQNANALDQIHMDVFLWGADGYRSLAPIVRETPVLGALTVSATDPRTSWGTLEALGGLARPAANMLYSLSRAQMFYPGETR